MEHNDDIGAQFQRFVITGLLVAAITPVLVMPDDMGDPQLAGHGDGPVTAVVVHQHHLIDDIERDLRIGLAEGKLCVIGGENDDQFFSFYHKMDGKRTLIGAILKIWPLQRRGGTAICPKKASGYQLLSLPRSRSQPAHPRGNADPDRYANTRPLRPREG